MAAEVEFTLALAAEETRDRRVRHVLAQAWPGLVELMPYLLEAESPAVAFLAILWAMRGSEINLAGEPGPLGTVRAARACLETVLNRNEVTL